MSYVTRKENALIWCCLEFQLEDAEEDSFRISYSKDFIYQIETIDEMSKSYELQNWESGVLSGIFYALRQCDALSGKRIIMHRLVGRLGAPDMDGVAFAAVLETAKLLGRDPVEFDLLFDEWRVG